MTFRRDINLHMFREEFVEKKRVFDKRNAHSKAVLDESLISVDTTSLKQRSHTSHIIQELRYPWLFSVQWLFPY